MAYVLYTGIRGRTDRKTRRCRRRGRRRDADLCRQRLPLPADRRRAGTSATARALSRTSTCRIGSHGTCPGSTCRSSSPPCCCTGGTGGITPSATASAGSCSGDSQRQPGRRRAAAPERGPAGRAGEGCPGRPADRPETARIAGNLREFRSRHGPSGRVHGRQQKARLMVHIWNDPSEVPADFGPSVVTFGNFDGVHRGHQQVLSQLIRTARLNHARAVADHLRPASRAGAPAGIRARADHGAGGQARGPG